MPTLFTMKDNKPQSIIHQALRLEKAVVKKSKSIRKTMTRTVSWASSSNESSSYSRRRDGDDETLCSLKGESASVSTDDLTLDLCLADYEKSQDLFYRTIDQNELMVDCFINGKERISLIHFFKAGSPFSCAIDQQMEEIAKELNTNQTTLEEENIAAKCQLRRIDPLKAPFIASKLKLMGHFPAVIVLKDGEVADSICKFSSPACIEFKSWAMQQVSDFVE